MDAKRFVTATLVGGIVLYATGYLIFDLAFGNFYETNLGSATGVTRDSQVVWAVILGSFSYAALVAYAIGSRGGSLTIASGLTAGAIVGFLLWFTADFVFYGTTNVPNLTRTIVDPLLEIVHGAIGGGSIAVALPRVRPASPAST